MPPPPPAPTPLTAWLDDVTAEVTAQRAQHTSVRRLLTLPVRAPRVIRRRIREEGLVPTLDLLALELRRVVGGLVRRVRR
jgi:hypothetical protein